MGMPVARLTTVSPPRAAVRIGLQRLLVDGQQTLGGLRERATAHQRRGRKPGHIKIMNVCVHSRSEECTSRRIVVRLLNRLSTPVASLPATRSSSSTKTEEDMATPDPPVPQGAQSYAQQLRTYGGRREDREHSSRERHRRSLPSQGGELAHPLSLLHPAQGTQTAGDATPKAH